MRWWLGWALTGFITFCLWRGGIPLIWDDSPIVAFNRFDRTTETQWNLSNAGFWGSVFKDGFNHIARGGYRPLSETFRNIGTAYFSNDKNPFWIWLVLIALCYGAFFSCYAAVAKRFQIPVLGIALGVFVFFTSPAQLGASWVLFAGLQILVPLWILLELFIYLRFLDEKISAVPILGLCVCFVVGPWWREFTGVGPVLIAAWELMNKRRWRIFALSAFGLLLAVFPTWIGVLFWSDTMSAKGIFGMGSLGDQVSVFVLRTQIFPVLLLFYSSFFWTALLISVGYLIWSEGARRWISKIDLFLLFFFALTFLPFLRVYTAPVHLAYCIVPFSLLSARWIALAWVRMKPKARPVLGVLVGLAITDQLLTAYASHESTHEVLAASQRVGEWLKTNTPKNSMVLSNALHGEDIRLSQNGHNRFFYTMGAGVNVLKSIVDTPAKLQTWLEQNFSTAKIYLLATEFEYTPDKVGYHSHHFLRKNCLEVERVQEIKGVDLKYPIIDPLKSRVPRHLIAFLASPDLENDFYRGPAREDSTWRRELSNEYQIFEVKSSTVRCP